MFNSKTVFSVACVLCIASASFAQFNITNSMAINAVGGDPTGYTATIANPNITLDSDPYPVVAAGPTYPGASAIAAFGLAPSYVDALVVKADVSSNGGDSDCGLILKFNNSALSGYMLSIDFKSAAVDIMKITGGVGSQVSGTHATISGFSLTETYSMRFTYDDGFMTGQILDHLGNLKASVSGTDSDYEAYTLTGVLASTNFTGGAGTGLNSTKGLFENYSAVPEPVTVLLLGAGIVGFIARRKRD